jgi:hypothetical protein
MEAGLNKATAGFAREVWRLYFWALARAFASEVDTGSRQENAIKQRSRDVFRFHGIGKCSIAAAERIFKRSGHRFAARKYDKTVI